MPRRKATRQCLVDDTYENQDRMLYRKVLPTTSTHAAELDTKDPRKTAALDVPCAVNFYLDDYTSNNGDY